MAGSFSLFISNFHWNVFVVFFLNKKEPGDPFRWVIKKSLIEERLNVGY
jgi:hypothetical protein